ncbi:hypothetical protein BCR42DRAFT_453505, partial [Absidia repens]
LDFFRRLFGGHDVGCKTVPDFGSLPFLNTSAHFYLSSFLAFFFLFLFLFLF